jgi:hypothetical protein
MFSGHRNTIATVGAFFMAVIHAILGWKSDQNSENLPTEPQIFHRYVDVRAKQLKTILFEM